MGAGWRYGLVLSIALIVVGSGWDAWQLADASVDLFWAKLLGGAPLIIPLSVVAGLLSSLAHRSFLRKCIIWVAWGLLTALIFAHLPFEISSAMSWFTNSSLRGQAVFPFTSEAEAMLWLSCFFGVLAGLPAALLQVLGMEWAWDRSGSSNALTLTGWTTLLLAVPLALALGAFYDAFNNATLRAPMLLTAEVVNEGLQSGPDSDTTRMRSDQLTRYVTIVDWSKQLSANYTQYLADYDPDTFEGATVDIAFDNGFMLRCSTGQYGRNPRGCIDLASQFRDWMARFLVTGSACSDCALSISSESASWRTQQQALLRGPDSITITHLPGRFVLVSATLVGGRNAVCQFEGANPTVIENCTIRR